MLNSLLILAAVVAFATPSPTGATSFPVFHAATPPPIAAKMPPALRASMIYADGVCEFAKLGHIVNARLDGDSAAYPIGPWHLYCEKGDMIAGWVKQK